MNPTPEQLKARWKTADGQKRLAAVLKALGLGQEWEAILVGFPYTEGHNPRDLRGAYFATADLTDANLTDADLTAADLREAVLIGTNFTDADLCVADLYKANLSRAVLVRANLSLTKLFKANLTETNFSKARLGGALLDQAKLIRTNLADADLSRASLNAAILNSPNLIGANLYGANLSGAILREPILGETDLTGADLSSADLAGVNFNKAALSGAVLIGAKLIGANLSDSDLSGANLSWANLDLATLLETDLTRCQMVNSSLKGANISGATVFGVSVWDLKLDDKTKQDNLVITDVDESKITVDDIRVAQFIYLLLNNPNIRDVIDTVAKKVVLILGRFTPERKAVLDAIRAELRERGYCPVLFDFEKPATRDITETVSTLAHMARFVIADLTDPRSIPHELMSFVEKLPSVAVQPLILRGQSEYGMFEHLMRYPWVLPIQEYDDQADLVANIGRTVIAPAEAKTKELLKPRE